MILGLRRWLGLLAVAVVLTTTSGTSSAQTPPTATDTWFNFSGVGTTWSTATSWFSGTAPTGSPDTVLLFGSSSLQVAGGYTTTYNSLFNTNAIVSTSFAASNPSIVFTGGAAGNSIVFNTSTSIPAVLPSIWQTGSGRILFQNGAATNGITLAGGATGTNLQIRGAGIGETQIFSTIVETGAASGLTINTTGTRPFSTGNLVRITSANSTFTGGVTLTSGNLLLANPSYTFTNAASQASPAVTAINTAAAINALGPVTNVLTVNGGTLQFEASSFSVPAGFIPTSTTTTPAQPGTYTLANPITLNSTLTVTGNNGLSAAAALITTPLPVVNASPPVGGIIANFSGIVSGNGGLTFAPIFTTANYAFTNANTFTGPVTIAPIGNTSTNILVGTATSTGGQFQNTTSIKVVGSNSITANNANAVLTRFGNTPNVELLRGGFTLWGNPGASSSETLGTVTVGGMASLTALTGSSTATTATLTLGTLTRNPRATLAFTGSNLGSGSGAGEGIIIATNDPLGSVGGGGSSGTPTVNILPYAFADSSDTFLGFAATNTFSFNGATTPTVNSFGLVRWGAGGRITPLTATEYTSNLYLAGTTAPTNNTRYQSSSALPNAFSAAGLDQATAANALVLDTNNTAVVRVATSVGGTGTLTLGGGAILVGINGGNAGISIPSLINVGGLNFGVTTGYVHTVANLISNAPITGSAGLVKSGAGTLFLNGINSFTGGLNINAGTLNFTTDANLGAAGGTITLAGGIAGPLSFTPNNLYTNSVTNALTVSRPIVVTEAGGAVNAALANTTLTLSGAITGTGQLLKSGAGVVSLTGTNTWAGNVVVQNGTLSATSDAALGDPANSIIMAAAIFQAGNSFTTNRDILLTGNSSANLSTILTNGFNLTVGGNITSQSNIPILLKETPGDLILTGTNTFTGQLQNGTSTVAVRGSNLAATTTPGRVVFSGPNGSAPLAAAIFSIGTGEIVLDNTSAVNNNRIGSVTVGLSGGKLTLLGNSAAPVVEAVGNLTLNGSTSANYGGTISLTADGGQSTTLDALGLTVGVGTFYVRGTNLGATSGTRTALNFNAVTNTPVAVNGLLPMFVGSSSADAATTLTAEPTDFIRKVDFSPIIAPPNINRTALSLFSAYITGTGSLGAGAAANTFNVTAAASFTGASAANALRIVPGGSVDLGTGTLTLAAGAILSTGGSNGGITNGTVAFGANVARITVNSDSPLSLPATTGTGGFAKYGLGILTLNSATTITGTIAVGQGTLRAGVANVLPAATQLFINGSAVFDLNNTNQTLNNIQGFGNVNLGTGNSLTITTTTSPLTAFGGSLIGSGGLIKSSANTSTFTLSGNSPNFSGPTSILNGGITVNSGTALGTSTITLGDTTGTSQALLTLGTTVQTFGNPIVIASGATPSLPHTLTSSAGIITINSSITMNQAFRLAGSSGLAGGNTTINGTISGSGNLTIGSGNWTLNSANNFIGNTTLDTTAQTALGLGNNSALSTGTLTFATSGGNLRADGGTRTLANNIILNSGVYFGVTGTNPLILNGTFDLGSATVVGSLHITNTANTTINGVISNGSGGIAKNGPGVLILGGNNVYTGTTTVNAGTLQLASTGVIPGATQVNSGAILKGIGSIGGPVTVAGGGILAPGASPGTLTLAGGLTTSAGSILSIGIFNGSTPAAINTGGSTDLGALPNPTRNNFLNFTGGTVAIDPGTIIRIDGTGVPFTVGSAYSYQVAQGAGDQTLLNITNPANFVAVGFLADTTAFSLTGTLTGEIFLNFTPVPEPTTILAISAGLLGAGAWVRRRRANRIEANIAA